MATFKRIGTVLAVGVFLLAAVAVTLFAIGKPMTPQAPPAIAAPAGASPNVPGGPAAGSAVPSSGAAPTGPLAIEIPGCVCHSDDPQLVAEHATYRMSQCFDCHQGGMPEMGR